MKRAPTAALAALLMLTGCRDMGLEGNLPLEEAEGMEPTELVASVHDRDVEAEEAVIFDRRLWVPWGRPLALDLNDLRPVGSVQGVTLHVRRWDGSPYDAILARTVTGTWQSHAPVIGHSGGIPGGAH